MNNPLSTAYLRFLELSRAIKEGEGETFSANQKALLEAVALAWHKGNPMSVRQAIAIEQLGSPATLHKRLAVLRKNGYIEEIAVEGDRRTKLLGPTEKAIHYFTQLGDAMTLEQA
ncbi:MAG: hypothetical protein ACKO0Z_04485 [Betaproteobacteria bacterium]